MNGFQFGTVLMLRWARHLRFAPPLCKRGSMYYIEEIPSGDVRVGAVNVLRGPFKTEEEALEYRSKELGDPEGKRYRVFSDRTN